MMREPRAPDPSGWGLWAVVAALAVYLLLAPEGDWIAVLAAAFVGGGFFLLYLRAHRSYRDALQSWALLRRSTPPASTESVYTITGVVSIRTADGGWLDIGEGVGTITLEPLRPVLLPGNPMKYGGRDLSPRQLHEIRKRQTPPTG